MALIDGIIPEQKYELIRDRIAQILAAELGNQGDLHSPQEQFVKEVYLERFTSFDISDFPYINVSLANMEYDNKDQRQADGLNKFYIVAYTAQKTEGSTSGDTRATIKLHRLLGLCRSILSNPIHRTLGFTAAEVNIKTTYVSSITIPKVDENGDMVNAIMGFIEFFVKAPEDVVLKEGVVVGESYTTVKLYNTEKGYYYKYERP